MGQGPSGFDPLWSVFRVGAPAGGCGPVQRGLLLGRAADQRVWHTHRTGGPEEGCVTDCAGFGRGGRRFRIAWGLVLSFGLSRLISRWVENGAHDPMLILGVSGVILAVAALACLVPSWRASSVDPMTALRCE